MHNCWHDASLGQQLSSNCKLHWCGFMASLELCTTETLVLKAGRDLGCKWPLDGYSGSEKPVLPVCDGGFQKGFKWCQ
jgi:hypothetical protein